MRQSVHVRGHAHFQLEVVAVDAAVGFIEPPRVLACIARPAGHAHQHGGEAFPLQVAGEGLGAAAEDRVHVATGVGHAGQARADQGRDVPADVIPAAALVAGPGHRIALDAAPAHHRPQERARIGVVHDAVERGLVGIHGELIALAGPGHVQLLHAAAGGADFPGDLVDAVLGPQAGPEAVLRQPQYGLGQLFVAAAVTIVGEDPAAGHVVLAVLPGHAVDHVGGGAGRAVAPAVGHAARLFDVIAIVVAVGVAIGERPARQQAGAAGQRGVTVQQRMQAGPDEVVRIEAVLAVQQRGLVGLAQIVGAVAPGIAQHAPAPRAQQHRRRVGAIAFFPATGVRHLQFAALELEATVLLATAVEVLIAFAGEHLHALVLVQVQRLQFAPQRDIAVALAADQRQAQWLALDVQDQRIGADAHLVGILFQLDGNLRGRLRQHDRGGLVAGTGERAVAAGAHAQDVIAQQVHAHRGAGIGAERPTGGAVVGGGGTDRTQVTHRRGTGGAAQRHCGKQCNRQTSAS